MLDAPTSTMALSRTSKSLNKLPNCAPRNWSISKPKSPAVSLVLSIAKNLCSVKTRCQKMRSHNCFANGSCIVQNCDLHDNFLLKNELTVLFRSASRELFLTKRFQIKTHIPNGT